jgi:hypothetical protein
MVLTPVLSELFIYLVPANTAAKHLFSHIIRYIKSASDEYHARFLEEGLQDRLFRKDTSSTDSDLTDALYNTINNLVPEAEPRTGSFVLSFYRDKIPAFPNTSWRAGRGTSRLLYYGVNFLLASPRYARRSELLFLGAYFRFHPGSGMLMLIAGTKSIVYKINGKWVEITPSDQYILL